MGEIVSLYQPEREPLRGADEICSRAAVEAEAYQLLATRDSLPTPGVYTPERRDNARTAIMEALTASGHLSRIEISGSLEDINSQILRRLLNGCDGSLPLHEKQRRFAELCNELIIQKIHRAIAAGYQRPSTAVLEISDYMQNEADSVAEALGYRAENKKGMVRSTHLRRNSDGSYTRIIEQISRSQGTAETTFAFLHAGRIYPTGHESPDVLALKVPVLYDTDDFREGVVDVQRKLDKYAGAGVRYGERGNPLHVAYEALRVESARREEQMADFIDRLAAYDLRLEQAEQQGSISPHQRKDLYNVEIRQILRAICVLDPDYAAACFGSAAAVAYERAAMYEAQGDRIQAMAELNFARTLENPIIFCGVSIAPEKIQELGLQIDNLGQLITEGKNSWKWTRGVCRVQNCPSPKPTEVGPCSVCRHCQRVFDKGIDPTKIAPIHSSTVMQVTVRSLFKKQSPAEQAAA